MKEHATKWLQEDSCGKVALVLDAASSGSQSSLGTAEVICISEVTTGAMALAGATVSLRGLGSLGHKFVGTEAAY
jgi:hypothetical protein